MRYKLIVALYFMRVMFSCGKSDTGYSTALIDISITSTTTPASQTQQGITSQVRCMQSNTCEKFSNIEIKASGSHEFAIRAKGKYPVSKDGFACGQIVTYKDTAVNIPAASKGQYLLHFYNKDILFKTDTVQVN